MINEINVNCFLSLADTLNFTKTASDLFMSQQAVSKNIAKLEERLETTLFIRDHHNVQLTKTGRKYYELFYRLKDEFNEARKNMSDEDAAPSLLRVGYQQYMDLGEYIYRVQQEMREIDPAFKHLCYKLSPNDLMESLMSDKLDIIILYERFVRNIPRCISHILNDVTNIMLISRMFPGASENATYEDFSSAPFIYDSVEESGKTGESIRRARSYIEEIGLYPSEINIVNNRETAYTAAEQGLGYVITTKYCHYIDSGLLYAYPVPATERIIALWKKSYFDQETAGKYAEILEQLMK